MPSRSSIFSFDTLTVRPKPTPALLLAIGLCAAFRMSLYAARSRLDHVPAASIHPQFIAREYLLVRRAKVRPRIVLMGDSITLYGLREEQLAAAAGLEPDEVVNLGVESGRAWDALLLLRRNPEFFSRVQLVVFNVTLSQVTLASAAKRLPHFYRFSTLREKLQADAPVDRLILLLDWAWPFFSERRDWATWLSCIAGVQAGSLDEPLRPAWEAENMKKLRTNPRSGGGMPAPLAESRAVGLSKLHQELLDRFVRHWVDQNVPVLLVCMPVAPSFADSPLRAGAPPEWVAFRNHLDSLTGGRVAVWDLKSRARDLGLEEETDYLDEGHLTPCGAEKMTAVLVEQLDRLGWLRLSPGRLAGR